jgi:hypothetical protein
MAAYNPPDQILFSPVTNYYQGKALRADTALREKQAEALQYEMDSAPAAAAAAARKEDREIAKARREAEEAIAKGQDREAGIIAEAGAAAVLAKKDGKSNEDATAAFDSVLKAYGATDDGLKEFKSQWDPDGDGIFDDGKFGPLEAFAVAIAEKGKLPGSDAPSELTKLQNRLADPNLRPEDRADIKARIAKLTTVTGRLETDPSYDPRTNSQKGAAYQQSLDEYNVSSDVQEMITSALPQIIDLPGAVGMRGALSQGISGVLSSLGQEEMANAFSEYMSGASPEEVAQIQTQLQTIRGRIIPIVTGERGKRLSETEREIASRTVGLIENIKGPADLAKSYPKVLGAMRQLYAESWATKYRIAKTDETISYPYDLSVKQQRIELLTEFSDAGVDIDTAKRTVIRLKSIQGVE